MRERDTVTDGSNALSLLFSSYPVSTKHTAPELKNRETTLLLWQQQMHLVANPVMLGQSTQPQRRAVTVAEPFWTNVRLGWLFCGMKQSCLFITPKKLKGVVVNVAN